MKTPSESHGMSAFAVAWAARPVSRVISTFLHRSGNVASTGDAAGRAAHATCCSMPHCLLLLLMMATTLSAQPPGAPQPPGSGKAAAPVDLTGYWGSVVTEDWRWRMVTPIKGDFISIPLSDEGRRVTFQWDPQTDGSCKAFGAAGLMRMPGRLRISWQDDAALKVE